MATATKKRPAKKRAAGKKKPARRKTSMAAPRDPAKQLNYEAVEDKKRRKAPSVILRNEDEHLDAAKRRKMTSTARDAPRNFALASWAIACHTAYVASFSFHPETGNDYVDQALTESVPSWQSRYAFDFRHRHSLQRFLRLTEIRRTVDGDVFWHKMRDGSVAAIEEDRIRQPTMAATLPRAVNLDDVTHGVWETPGGRVRGYCLHNRTKAGGFEFQRVLKPRYVFHHCYGDRFDQTRGISPLAPAINTLRDLHESLTFAQIKTKIGQLFGFAVKWSEDREDSPGNLETTENDDGSLDKAATETDFGRAPFILDLLPDEEVIPLESAQPASDAQSFWKLCGMLTLRALHIPWCFFDEAHTTYSGQRNAWLVYDRMSQADRQDNRELLDAWLRWRVAVAILAGQLVLPRSFTVKNLRWSWISTGIPWVQPLQEIKADREAVAGGMQSTNRICLARHGVSAYTIADEEAALQDYRRNKGLIAADPRQPAESKDAAP